MTTLSDVLANAAFGVYGVPPSLWRGEVFVGDVVRAPTVRAVQLVYLSPDGTSNGCAVSSVDASYAAETAGESDPLTTHLLPFVSRFDPQFVVARAGKRRFVPFALKEFITNDLVIAIAGEQTGATLYAHRDIPVQLLRAAFRKGAIATDLGVLSWRVDVRPFAGLVQPVDVRLAKDFDSVEPASYPPRGWSEPDPTEE